MASVNYQKQINAPAQIVWELLADFGAINKWANPQLILSSTADSHDVGGIRTIETVKGTVKERIELIDHDLYRLGYSIVDGADRLSVSNYLSIIKVSKIDEKSCLIDWQSTFEPVTSIEQSEATILGFYTGGIQGIEKYLGA